MWQGALTLFSFLWLFLFHLVELGLLVFATLTPIPVWFRLAMMGTHCLFVLMTFSLLVVWARLATMDTHSLFVLSLSHLLVVSEACDDGHSLFVRPYDPLSSASLSLWQQALSGCSLLRHSLFYVLWKCPSIYFTCISSSLICYVHVSYSCKFDPLTLLWMPVLSSHSGEGVQAFVPPR